jgi:citrate synthase
MTRTPKPIRSDISWSTSDRIVVRGLSLPDEILGHMSLADFSFLQLTGRRPTPEQSRVYDAILVSLVEHGMTPSAIAARITYMGAPESLQAAVAAGISGLGTVFVGSMEGAAQLLSEALPADAPADTDLLELASEIVATYRAERRIIPGLGHPFHKPIDPRTPRLIEIAEECGYAGRYVELVQLIAVEAQRASGRELPVNATGIIGALCCELGFPWQVVRGFGVMARAVGLVGHILEERTQPMAAEIWARVEDEASAHARPA